MRVFFKMISLVMGCMVCSSVVFAKSADLTSCPSIHHFKVSSFDFNLSYGYDVSSKSMNLIAGADYPSGANEPFTFVIYPVNLVSGETLLDKVNGLIPKLQLVAEAPFTYKIDDENGSVSACVYHLPGNQGVTAYLYAEDSSDDEEQDYSIKKEHALSMFQQLARR